VSHRGLLGFREDEAEEKTEAPLQLQIGRVPNSSRRQPIPFASGFRIAEFDGYSRRGDGR